MLHQLGAGAERTFGVVEAANAVKESLSSCLAAAEDPQEDLDLQRHEILPVEIVEGQSTS